MPLYGSCPPTLTQRLEAFQQAGVLVVLVLNQPDGTPFPESLKPLLNPPLCVVPNYNHGGVAGGFNRGVEHAIAAGATWITLLDQDSDLSAMELQRLQEPWRDQPGIRCVVGPRIWDARREHWHGRRLPKDGLLWHATRLLISSGTTFRATDWPLLGPMQEWLVVDFVDHAWSFQAQARGFQLLQHTGVTLRQQFGARHPHVIGRCLGMELYPPRRHFYGLRNLRWLLRRPEVPWDLKAKEVFKMLFKPWLWLLLEPQRLGNLQAIVEALRAPLPMEEAQPD